MGPDWSSTARVQRGSSEAARCVGTEDHQALFPPLFSEQEDDLAARFKPLPSSLELQPYSLLRREL
jgi:hypothetical protein